MERERQPSTGDEVRGRVGGPPTVGDGVSYSPVDGRRCPALPVPRADGRRDGQGWEVGAPREPDTTAALSGARSALASVRGGIARLRDQELWTLGQRDLLALTEEVETTLRAGFGVQVRLAGEIHERGVCDMLDARSAAHLLHGALNITMSDARARVAAATAGLPMETATGAQVAPTAPELIPAIDAGALSAGHAKVITHCLARIPDAVDPQTRLLCRTTLIDQARIRDENGLRQVADQIIDTVDPDGSLSGKSAEERAELHIGAKRRDGITPIRGGLSPLTAEQFRLAIEALSAPRPIDENTPDPRPAPLRREQALGEILHRHLTAGAGPRDGGVRPQVVVTINLDDLIAGIHRLRETHAQDGADGGPAGGRRRGGGRTGADPSDGQAGDGGPGGGEPDHAAPTRGFAWTDYDGVQSAAMARILACDAEIIPQVLGSDSVVLDQGRAVRLFTAVQRRAITTRDKGCAFPGCDIPPSWCEAHHLVWWSDGGTTDITNGVLLCRRHHVLIHRGHWRIEPDPGGGRPWFVPPNHIDPRREPRRNSHFHLPERLAVRR